MNFGSINILGDKWIILSCDLYMIQNLDACITMSKLFGEIFWRGRYFFDSELKLFSSTSNFFDCRIVSKFGYKDFSIFKGNVIHI